MVNERIGKLLAAKLVKTAADVNAAAPQPSAPAKGLLLMPPPKAQSGSGTQQTEGATASVSATPKQ
jgi:hypothetical protein